MKFPYAYLSIAALLISCSDDPGAIQDAPGSRHQRAGSSAPLNGDNPYETAGVLHGEIYDACQPETGPAVPVTAIDSIGALANQVALENDSFSQLAGSGYSFGESQRVAHIISHDCTALIIETAFSSTSTRTNFGQFIATLAHLCKTEEEYAPIHDYVVAYEDSITANAWLSNADKKTILCSTSIARHAIYRKKKRPKKNTDPEWDMMIGNVMAGTEGAAESIEKAIMMSVVANLAADE